MKRSGSRRGKGEAGASGFAAAACPGAWARWGRTGCVWICCVAGAPGDHDRYKRKCDDWAPGSMVDRRYQQIQPTQIALPENELDAKARADLIRFLISDQGFAMRPFPRGHKGLTLVANGEMEPAGEAYLAMATSEGISAKPGDRLVITDVKIENRRSFSMLNGGPDAKHRFLQPHSAWNRNDRWGRWCRPIRRTRRARG